MGARNTSEHAKALSAIGAQKGGKARARNLTPEARRKIARQAAEARWGEEVPRAIYSGKLEIAGHIIDCAVLENGTRLLTQQTLLNALGHPTKRKGRTGKTRPALLRGLPPFLATENLQPFLTPEILVLTNLIVFRSEEGKVYGYDARLLPSVCEVYHQAKIANRLQTEEQQSIATLCAFLANVLAQEDMLALVDEASGYRQQQEIQALRAILAGYVSEALRPWLPRFPDEFFQQMYRLYHWHYQLDLVDRARYIGRFIHIWIYEQLSSEVIEALAALQGKNLLDEKVAGLYKLLPFVSEPTGIPDLDKQLTLLIALMRISADKHELEMHLERAFMQSSQEKQPLVVEKHQPRMIQRTLEFPAMISEPANQE
jgi:hypothetical protein